MVSLPWSRMRKRPFINLLRLSWIVLILWYEIGIFYASVGKCPWPSLNSTKASAPPTHVLIIADPQILDHRSYPDRSPLLTYLSQVFTDLNLRKNWRAARRTRPDAVVFLGDMMDSARFRSTDQEYESYYERFTRIFKQEGLDSPRYFIPGNHDTGLGVFDTSFSAQARARYVAHFGPLNSQISLGGHSLVFLDAPALVEEDTQRTTRRQAFSEWQPVPDGPVDFLSALERETRQPAVLFTHIPLSRPEKTDCGPYRERGYIRSGVGNGYQNTISEDASKFVLERVQPTLIFSGDDHDYCEYVHAYQTGSQRKTAREVTVKSLSMAMGIRQPGFQLLSLAPPSESGQAQSSDSLCLMPGQLDIYLSVYVPLIVLSVVLVLLSNLNISFKAGLARHRAGRANHDTGEDSATDEYELLPPPSSASSTARAIFESSRWVGRQRRSYMHCVIRNVRDVAVLPVILFLVISWWYLSD